MTDAKPRIVSLLPAATEMICGAGLGESLVGVSHECNWPPGVERLPRVTRTRVDSTADSRAIDDQVKSLLAADEPLYEVDARLLAALRPTLIVTQTQCDVCAVSYTSVAQAVAENPPLAAAEIISLNPRSLAEVLADVERLGDAAGAAPTARAFTASLRRRIDVVRRMVATRAGARLRTAVIEWVDPLMVAGNWTPELVELAGGNYGLAVAVAHSPCVDWETLINYLPELIVVAPCGFGLARSRAEARRLASRPDWQGLPAVTSGRVLVVDGDAYFNRPGPRLVDSLELLARALHGRVAVRA